MSNSRRNFLITAALGTAAVPFGKVAAAGQTSMSAEKMTAIQGSDELLKLGVATFSLRDFSRSEAIQMINEIGARYVNIKSFHLPKEYSPEELRAGRREFESAGLKIMAGGVVQLPEDDDDHIRNRFEYAKHSGLPVMVIAPTPENLPRVEKFVKEYDIKVAIHNHGPETTFPGPADVLKQIKNMDIRVGICNDLGHTARTGVDIIESIAISGERLYDVHLKDLRDLSDNDTQCVIGKGKMPVPDIFLQLVRMNYHGPVSLEYEIERDNPLEGMKQSFSYMQGVADGLGLGLRI